MSAKLPCHGLRLAARDDGKRKYSGTPCRHCDGTTRYVSTGQCRDCNIKRASAHQRKRARATDDGHSYDNRGDSDRRGNWQQVFTGRQFWPIDPRPEEVDIRDIAHALALQCRYGGHCERFYSVAEHSVLVSHVVPPELALMGLLHDASEAYVVDIPRPLKPYLEGYKALEDAVWRAIATRFGLPHEMPKAIKDADNAVLLAEAAVIMKPHPAPWCIPGEPARVKISCWSPTEADIRFRARFAELAA